MSEAIKNIDEKVEAEREPDLSADSSLGKEVVSVYGSSRNIRELGAPSDHQIDVPFLYYFYPTWRSQLLPLVGFVATSILGVSCSQSKFFEWFIVSGKLIEIGGVNIYLTIPLLMFIPGFLLIRILFTLYNSRFIIDERGVEAQVGLVSLSLRQPRLRFEDIRGVEPKQTLLERVLGIGNVAVGSAMTFEAEIEMIGVPNPRGIQLLIGKERDKRLMKLQGHKAAIVTTVTGD